MRKIYSSLSSLLFIAVTTLFANSLFAQAPVNGDYRTGQAAVTWATAGHWQTWNGTTWATASSAPGASANVYVQSGHVVTLGADAACNNLRISTGTTNAITGSEGQVALTAYVLSINGKLANYFGTVSTTLNTTNLTVTVSTTVGPSPITKTANSATGRIKFVGSTRTIIASTDWGAGNTGATTTFDVEVAMTAGQTATAAVSLKAYNFFITSGELNAGTNRMSSDNGTTGQGNFTISSGATFISAATGTGTNAIIGRGAASAAGTFTNNGTLKLSGAAPTIAMTTVTNANGSSVEYTAAGNQTLLALTNSGAAMNTYHHLTTSGSGTKTLVAATALAVNGNINITGTSTLADAANQITGTSGMLMNVASGCGYTTTRTATPWWPLNLVIGNLTLDNNSTVSYNGTVSLSTVNLFPTTYGNLSFTAGVLKTLPASTNILVNKDLTISSTAILADNGNTIRVLGNVTNSATHSGAGKIYLNGSLLQTLTGTGAYGNLELDNSAGASLVTSAASCSVGGLLKLTSGNLTLNTNTLTLAAGSSVNLTGTITGSATSVMTVNGTGALGTLKFTSGAQTLNNFTINRTSSGSVTLGTDLNVRTTLTMTAGNIDATGYTLTLGISPATNGALSYTAGFVTGGNFARYVPTAGINLSPPSTTNRFPFGVGTDGRTLYYGQTSSTAGGLVTASHTAGTSFAVLGTPFTDNGTTVTSVSNAYWTVSSTATTTTGSLRLQANGSALGTPLVNFAAATAQRLTRVTDIVLNSGTGDTGGGTTTAPYVDKTAMPTSELSGNFYVGKGTTVTSVTSGFWGDDATWDCVCQPTSGDNVVIATGHNVTLGGTATSPYSSNDLTINATTSTLTASGTSNILNISGNVSNTGNFLMSGADVNVGPTGGGKKIFTNNANGILTISNASSALTVNGNVLLSASSTFNMSAGDFIVDGNDGTAGGSVASGTMIFDILSATGTVNGGTITIVDPHYANLNNNLAFRYNISSTGEDWTGNTLVFGGSSGTNLGANTYGFIADTYFSSGRMVLGNVTVNGGNTIANRFVSTNPGCTNCAIDIGGNLLINSNSEMRAVSGGSPMSVGTDLTNNGTLTIETTLGLRQTASASTANAQVISGAGVFRNSATSPTANYTSLTINNTNASGVTFSSSQSCSGTGTGTVSGTLTMTAGNINLNNNTFTLGTTNTSAGTFTYTAGFFQGGTLKRWFTTTSMATSIPANPQFPIASSGNNRSVFLARTTTTFTTGGSISITHTNTAGTTGPFTSFADFGQDINTQYNSNWAIVPADGLNISTATLSMNLRGDAIGTVTTPANLRIIKNQAIAGGTSIAGSGTTGAPVASKTTMNLTDLANTFYIGYGRTVQSIATGNWGDNSTWDCTCQPTSGDNVIINAGHIVTLGGLATSPYASGNLTVNATGSLVIADKTLNVGPTGGGNKTFSMSGTLTLANAAGVLNVNGNVTMPSTANFNMSAGAFNIDGNDGTSGGSVASGTNLFSLASSAGTVNGGTITIVDPPFTGAGFAFYYNTTTQVSWAGNTLRLGDGSSTNTNTATNGFCIDAYFGSGRLLLGNVIANGGNTSDRYVSSPPSAQSGNHLHIGGDLTINANSELRSLTGGAQIYVAKNISNSGTLTTITTLNLASTSAAATTNSQLISGSGVFRNATSGATANYTNLAINNTNASGVTFSSSQSCSGTGTGTVSGTLTMTAGNIDLNTNTFTLGTGTGVNGTLSPASPSSYFTNGIFTRWFSTTSMNAAITSPTVFPMAANGNNRSVYLADGGAAFTAGGTVSVNVNDVAGTTTFTGFTDNGQTINAQYNSNWVISTNLTGGASSVIMRLQADGVGSINTLADLRLIINQAIANGTSGNGTGTLTNPQVNKTAMSITNITNTFYVGYPYVTCTAPSAGTAANMTDVAADLNWTNGGSETLWDIEWMPAANSPTGTPDENGITSHPYTLGGLSASTDYKYYVRADCGVNGTSTWAGPFTFTTTPANNDCANAIALTVNSSTTCTSTSSGNSFGGTQSLAGCTGNADDDIWYSFQATAVAHTVTATPGTMTNVVLQIFSGSCGSLTSMVCRNATTGSNTETASVSGLTIGAFYYVRVHSNGAGGTGTVTMCVTTPPTPPVNDVCANAVLLTPHPTTACTTATSGTLQDALNDGGAGCSGGNSYGDVWYKFTATFTSHIVTVVPGANLDVIVEVYDDGSTCGSLVSAVCIDVPGAGGTETDVINGFTIGNTYYVRVSNFNATSSTPTFTICITSPYAPDPCTNLITLNSGVPETITLSGSGAGWGDVTSLGCSANLTPGAEQVYQFTPSSTGWYTVRTNSVSANPFVYYMYKPVSLGCDANNWNCIGTSNNNTPSININEIYLTGGTPYYILLDNASTNSTTHEFQIAPAIPAVLPTGTLFPSDGSTIYIPTNGWNMSGVNPAAGFGDVSFNSVGDALMVHFDSEPYKLIYWLEGATANVGTLRFQESVDGLTWSNIVTYTNNAPTTFAFYEHLLNTNSRFVRIWKETDNSNAFVDELAVVKKIDLNCTSAPINFYDKGGSGGNYGNAEYNVWTVIPQNSSDKVNVQFSSFNLENTYDYLDITNGNSANSTLLSSNTGTTNPTQQTSTATDGSLTIYMYSDYATTAAGWAATLNLVNTGARTWTGNTNTDWGTAGNWCGGGVPVSTTNVDIPNVINDPVVAGTAATCNNITLQSGATLGVPASTAITVNGAFTNDGTVNVANNGNFIQATGSTLAGSGTFNVTRNGTASATVYNYWSTPITSASLGLLGGANYLYNPGNGTADFSDDNPGPDPGWSAASGSFSIGKGYAGKGPNSTVTFTGTANNGTQTAAIQYFPLVNGSSSPGVPYNLVGNIYPSNIDAASFLTANNTKVTGAIYYWDDDNTGGTGYAANDYAIWNGTGSTGGGGRTPNGMIATAQGFFVQALSGATSVSFTNAMRASTATTFFKTEETVPQRLWLRADNGQHTNQILVGYVDGATLDMDWFYDAQKLRGNQTISFYSLLNDTTLLGIQGLAPLNGADPAPVPLGLYAGAAGQNSIFTDSIENFPANMPINLLDADLGIIYDLRNGPYVFQTAQGEDNDRFILFPNELVTAIDEQENLHLNIYPNPNNGSFTVMINSGIEQDVNVSLFDVTGKLVLAADKTISSGNNFIALETQVAGVYMLKVETADKAYIKRVVVY